MKKLSYRYAVYVPSDFNGSDYSAEQARQEAELFLTHKFGGCTTIPGKGNWLNGDTLVSEEVSLVIAYGEYDRATLLKEWAIEACKRWKQECVAIEHSNALWLVSQDDQPVL
jgi:hypothetical protein